MIYGRSGFQNYTISIKAGSSVTFPVEGDGFWVVEPVTAKVVIDSDSGVRCECEYSQGINEIKPFTSLQIYNNETYDQQVKMMIGFGKFQSAGGGKGSASVGASMQFSEPLIVGKDLPLTVPANASRSLVELRAGPNNTQAVWLGGVHGDGVPLYPNESIAIPVTGSFDLIADNASTETQVIYMQEVLA